MRNIEPMDIVKIYIGNMRDYAREIEFLIEQEVISLDDDTKRCALEAIETLAIKVDSVGFVLIEGYPFIATEVIK